MSELESKVALEGWLRERIAARLGCASEVLSPHVRFRDMGLDSVAASGLLVELSSHLGKALGPTIFWDQPTITTLAAHLANCEASGDVSHRSAVSRRETSADEPVAIVGMACRFPGADGLDAYWHLLSSGIDAVTEVPADRWSVSELFDTDRSVPGKSSTRWGGFLHDIGGFEPQFFGISPREAAEMDPQQRLMLELAWHAFEDAGVAADTLKGSPTGVFVGAMWSEYARHAAAALEQVVHHTATGQDHSLIAGRISYLLGLEGPSLVLNTACSSSLVAVHLACQSLRAGESELALAGGVSLMLSPYSSVVMSKFGAMSPNGRCRAFDSGADGYVRGEGCGLVVLKPLSRALAEGDRIYALVAGTAVNNDGWSNGLTAPNPAAQAAVLRSAYQRAGVATGAVQYVETHGPGTILGDPIEARALGGVLGAGRPPEQALRIGSVKTNLGHLEAAAGIAGLIKTTLAIHHRILPANLHFDAPNPHIAFADLRLEVQNKRTAWPRPDAALIAGVSSFGFSGTNCHVVLRQSADAIAPPQAEEARPLEIPVAESDSMPVRPPRVVFVCPGQGGQWHGMAVSLSRHEPAFRAALQEVDRAIEPITGWSVIDELSASSSNSRLDEVDVVQPLLFALQVALGRLWQARGIEPDVVVGHSMGEAAAAHLAGVLTLNDAARVICHRSRLARELRGQGAMAVVGLDAEAAAEALAPHADEVSIASCNSPTSTVISGTPTSVDEILAALQAEEVYVSRIDVDFASHSPQVEPYCAPLVEALAGLRPRLASRTLISTVTGSLQPGSSWDAAYWGRNLRQPVRFAQAIATIAKDGPAVFVELSPHPVLLRAVEETLAHHELIGCAVASLRREEDELAVLGAGLETLRGQGVRSATHASADLERERGGSVPVLLPLSARDPAALRAQIAVFLTLAERLPSQSLADLAHAASTRRGHHAERLAVVGAVPEALAEGLRHAASDEPHPAVMVGRAGTAPPARPVFVFPGQGSQWLGMGRQLWDREAVFRDAIVRCDDVIRQHVGWSLIDELRATEATSRLTEIDRVQPAIFAMQVALADLWRSWGIEPGAVIGHSMGEAAAAYTAGALSLEHASAVVCRRSKLLRRVSGQGAMTLVELSRDAAQALLDEAGHGTCGAVSIAVSNSPSTTVLAGEPDALEALIAMLEKRGVFCRSIRVDVASHTAQMDPLRDPLLACLDDLDPLVGSVPMHSTVLDRATVGAELDAAYWSRNLRQPVLFWNGVRALAEGGAETFVELSPHPVLLPSIVQGLQEIGRQRPHCALPSLRRGEDESQVMLSSLGALYVQGHPIDWRGVYPRGGRFVDLPRYPFQRQHYWTDSPLANGRGLGATAAVGTPVTTDHPLLGKRLVSPLETIQYQTTLAARSPEHLVDHALFGHVMVPGAQFLASVMAAAKAELGTAGCAIEHAELIEPLVLAGDEGCAVQLTLTPARNGTPGPEGGWESGSPDTLSWQVFSQQESATGTAAWTRHAVGTLRRWAPRHERESIEQAGAPPGLSALLHRVTEQGEAEDGGTLYQRLATVGYDLGPRFQRLGRTWRVPGEVLARLVPPGDETPTRPIDPSVIDPCVIDATLQTLLAALPDPVFARLADRSSVYVPFSIERLSFVGGANLSHAVWCHAAVRAGVLADAPESVEGDLTLFDQHGSELLEVVGLRLQRAARARLLAAHSLVPRSAVPVVDIEPVDFQVRWLRTEPAAPSDGDPGRWLILADRGGVGTALTEVITAAGGESVCLEADALGPADGWTDAFRASIEAGLDIADAAQPAAAWRGIVHLWSLDTDDRDAGAAGAQERVCLSVVSLLRAFDGPRVAAPRLFLVTRGAQPVAGAGVERLAVAQAPLWGLGSVLAMEHPELDVTRIDLSPGPGDTAAPLWAELQRDETDDQVALRGGERFVAHLARTDERAAAMARRGAADGTDPGALTLPDAPSFALEVASPGRLDSLRAMAVPRQAPGPGEIELRVRAAGLNFRDVLGALGRYPGDPGPLGLECAGVVMAVGDAVSDVAVGERVMAFAPRSFARFVTVSRQRVAKVPAGLSDAEAATVPAAFVTAGYALDRAAGLVAGERILIHGASGGVGIAAVQIALARGAEVFATAGNETKRSFLQSLGVRAVFDSRSLAFAADVRACTADDANGPGVEVVLNALTGDAIAESLALLVPGGRFVEMGKRGIWSAEKIASVRPDVAYHMIDLMALAGSRPEIIAALLADTAAALADGTLAPLPATVLPLRHAVGAFRLMAGAGHIGKIVLAVERTPLSVGEPTPAGTASWSVSADRTQLITGGLGGIGLRLARWLVDHGARHVVLLGRRALDTLDAETLAAVEALRVAGTTDGAPEGVTVKCVAVDITHAEALAAVLAEIDAGDAPLGGVYHAAGVLADGVARDLSWPRFRMALAPKIDGAWNLHRLTADQRLDAFVLFSSVAAWVGSPGQGNYAAGNAFLDALAHDRRARGLAATSINWGPWSEVGLAASRDDRGERLAARGLGSLDPATCFHALERLLTTDVGQATVQAGVMRFDAARWCEGHARAGHRTFFASLAAAASTAAATAAAVERTESAEDFRARLAQATSTRTRRALLQKQVRREVGQVLRIAPAQVDPVAALRSLGLDSLTSLELKNRLEARLSLTLSTTLIWNYPTVDALVEVLIDALDMSWGGMPEGTLGGNGAKAVAPPVPKEVSTGLTRSDVEGMDNDEVERQLAQHLARLGMEEVVL